MYQTMLGNARMAIAMSKPLRIDEMGEHECLLVGGCRLPINMFHSAGSVEISHMRQLIPICTHAGGSLLGIATISAEVAERLAVGLLEDFGLGLLFTYSTGKWSACAALELCEVCRGEGAYYTPTHESRPCKRCLGLGFMRPHMNDIHRFLNIGMGCCKTFLQKEGLI
jgi:hypothetical protein